MFESPIYIKKEYLYNNKVYKGRFPISSIEKVCPLGGYVSPFIYESQYNVPEQTLLEELSETEVIAINMESSQKIDGPDGEDLEVSAIITEDSINEKLNGKVLLFVV